MTRLAILLSLLTFPAHAETWELRGTTITLQQTIHPGALAEIEFYNANVNMSADNQTRTLTYGTVSATITFTYTPGRDRIDVGVPTDLVAIPNFLELDEETTGIIHIYPLEAVGM